MIEMIKLSFFNLFRRKTRTILSLLGIMISVATIIVMVSIVDGAEKQFNDIIAQFQGVFVIEKNVFDETASVINESYATKIANIAAVRNTVKGINFLPTKIDEHFAYAGGDATRDLTAFSYVWGIDPNEYNRMQGNGLFGELSEGSFLKANDKDAIVIGKKFADTYNKFVNSTVKINDKKFKVKGILKNESELMGSIIIMHIDSARELSAFPEGKISSIFVELNDVSLDKKIADKINFQYNELEARTMNDFSEQINNVMSNFRLVVFFVAAISAIVAGIGILNTMLMSVMERFQEIGTLKAIGWTDDNILLLILLESVILGFFGSITGILLGIFIGKGIIEGSFGLTVIFQPYLLIGSFVFGVGISILAGIYPARMASLLDPVEALRVE